MGKPAGLAKEQRRALDRLRRIREISGFYLADGSAIAVHLHHRRSVDLDVFSAAPDADLVVLRGALVTAEPNIEVIATTDALLRVRFGDVPVDIVRYPYATLDPPMIGREQFPVAGLRDLAAMKLAAISQRGLRRDFWDLHAIHTAGLSLQDATAAYRAKFGREASDLYPVIRSLTYFDDAERDPELPRGLTARAWSEIKLFFRREAPELLTKA